MQPEIVLNEFGELSRKARREFLSQGIDPDTAVIEHIRTQSIPIIPIIVDSAASPVAPEPAQPDVDSPVSDSPVFAVSLSRRDMRNLRDRSDNTAEIAIIAVDIAVDDDDDDIDVFSEKAPQTIAETTVATAIAGSIASRRRVGEDNEVVIDHREDSPEITEDYEPFSFSTTSTQSTGIIPTTGSALILPMLPEHAPGALSSFSHTGEIYLTGSINLPSGIGQYGADILRLDTSEIDIIADDEEVSSSQDLAPVRASSAVSAYSTSNTVVTVPSKFRDRLPLVLAITAAGLAVGVVALFITGYVLGVF